MPVALRHLICRFLAPGGRLVLELNEDVARYGARRWYDAELAHYFGTVGLAVRGWITIERDRAVTVAKTIR
jgi:hypothetical protein